MTPFKTMCLCLGVSLGVAGWSRAADAPPPAPPAPPPRAEAPEIQKISGPYTHANLTVFLLHGSELMPGRKFLTLQEALEQKLVIVHETSNVNQLAVENLSPDVEVFLMAGDIVKGGKQDRAIAYDMLLPRKSGKIGIGSFCVESGRWRGRGAEAAHAFSGSGFQAAGQGLKLAINSARDQREVWKQVEEAQKKLSTNVGKPVANPDSPSSLQLALEDKDLLAKVKTYEQCVSPSLVEGGDVIGLAVAINGKVLGAELFATHDLFVKLWPKLIRSAATEALAEFDAKKTFAVVDEPAVRNFLTAAADGTAREIDVNAPAEIGTRGQLRLGNANNSPTSTLRPDETNGRGQIRLEDSRPVPQQSLNINPSSLPSAGNTPQAQPPVQTLIPAQQTPAPNSPPVIPPQSGDPGSQGARPQADPVPVPTNRNPAAAPVPVVLAKNPLRIVSYDSTKAIMVESREGTPPKVLHRSYIAK